MITPRRTRLIRVPGLRAFQQVLCRIAGAGSVTASRRRAVIVPTRAAAEQVRRALEDDAFAQGAVALALPYLVTRDEWLAHLHDGLGGVPARLSGQEREVLLGAAARDAIAAGWAPPFTLRPGLVAEMLAFYDGLHRHQRTVDDFERLAGEQLERAAEADRGAARMLEQTRFMVAAFRGYDARLAQTGALDEHTLRQRLLAGPSTCFTHVIVAVADRAGEPNGLWPADFDLLTRLAGLTQLDVVATEAVLASGFLPRIQGLLPGLEETAEPGTEADGPPALIAPDSPDDRAFTVHRDREEELAAVARIIRHARRTGDASPLWRAGLVFKRPLPYVYLARQTFPAAGIPYQVFDALPLASEPYAAVIDLIVECVEADCSRAAIVALMRSPLLTFRFDGRAVSESSIVRFDRALSDSRYLGGRAELGRLVQAWTTTRDSALGEIGRAAVQLAETLAPLARPDRPSLHLDTLLRMLDGNERAPEADEDARDRYRRARAAVRAALGCLRGAHLCHDDEPRPFGETAAAIRRWIEQQTFTPRRGSAGVQMLDADSARFAALDSVFLVGLTQREWPEATRRSIFYPSSILTSLGWPAEADARAAERAAFVDLLHLSRRTVRVSTFTLEDDAIVEPSAYLEELAESGLPLVREAEPGRVRVCEQDALIFDPVRPDALTTPAAEWLAARLDRTSPADARFHGQAGGPGMRSFKVTAIDQYLACPFSFFATHVLRLEEEPEDEEALSPKTQGRVVHDVLERFYRAWQDAGRGAITWDSLPEARAQFAAVVDERLRFLPDSDAALQRARLLGSAVAPGFGDTVLQMEAERGEPVVERLLEHALDGETALRTGAGARSIGLRAKADRIDLLADGTFQLFDYKLSQAPDVKTAVQLPAYAASARQRLEGYRGRTWRPSDAAYVPLGGRDHYKPLARGADRLETALAAGEARLVDAVDRIERGAFPPAPDKLYRCTYCPFAAVCRKDYVDAG